MCVPTFLLYVNRYDRCVWKLRNFNFSNVSKRFSVRYAFKRNCAHFSHDYYSHDSFLILLMSCLCIMLRTSRHAASIIITWGTLRIWPPGYPVSICMHPSCTNYHLRSCQRIYVRSCLQRKSTFFLSLLLSPESPRKVYLTRRKKFCVCMMEWACSRPISISRSVYPCTVAQHVPHLNSSFRIYCDLKLRPMNL